MLKMPDIEKESINFKKMMHDSFVDISKEIKYNPPAISIGTNIYKGNVYDTPFGSYGDFSCIVGASKSRKTFFKSVLIACYIGGKSQNYFEDIKGHETENKLVIDIDTEQSKFHSQRVFKRVCEMVGTTPKQYKTHSLRKYSPVERFEFIEYLIYESEYKDKIGLISIDGFVDLCTDFNDLESSMKLVNKLMKWTEEKQIHITGILHANPNTDKPKGHLGSRILEKAETVAFVTKEDECSKVTCNYSRNIPFDEFYFKINKNDWLPYKSNKIDDWDLYSLNNNKKN